MVYTHTHTPQLVIHAYTAKSFTATSFTCSWELKQRIINVMTISLSGHNKVNYPEVLALDDKGAARSSQRKFFHCSNVMMQYLWYTKTQSKHAEEKQEQHTI